ncbi:MAG TPA: FkbM family methyltransferase [Candidatus Saccharimonadales bacterium]
MLIDFEHAGSPVLIEGFDGDHITREIERTSEFYEIELLRYIGNLYRTGTTIDVGAFIGNHSVYFGMFTEASKVIAVEPNPLAVEHLRRNIESNNLCARVDVVQAAAGAITGEVGIKQGRRRNRGHTVVVSGTDVILRTIDDIVGDDEVSVLKVDVEGYELEVLKDAGQLLSRQNPHVFAEARSRSKKRLLDEHLGGLGYKPGLAFKNGAPVFSYRK